MGNKDGKIAIITGGARGIGYAICERMAEDGATILMADIQEENLKKSSEELKSKGYKVEPYCVDLSKSDQIKKMFDFAVEKFDTVDILVNNAGIQIRCASVNFKEEDFDKICDVNLKACWITAQCAGKIMLAKGSGFIVSLSSGTASRATSQRAPYNLTKTAVEGLTRALGNEWARYGVIVNGVAPGWVKTEMVKDGLKAGIVKEEEIFPMMPVNRFLEPREVANTVNFLASDQATGIIGQTIYCDGGGSIRCVPEENFKLEIL